MNWRLPVFVRSQYILSVYRNAIRNYAPQSYPGPAVYFKSMSRSSINQELWGGVMSGGLAVYEVPGDHMDVIRKENANAWAEPLKNCLAEAQRRATPRLTFVEDQR